jgi:hypothetical protein
LTSFRGFRIVGPFFCRFARGQRGSPACPHSQSDKTTKTTKTGEGNILRDGLRKKGVSKEKRKEPIVQMRPFIDAGGISIAHILAKGNGYLL